MKMLNVADKQVWSTRSVYNTWKDSLCNLHKQSRITHAIVKVKFQLPSWPHCFPLACKKWASSLKAVKRLNWRRNCLQLKTTENSNSKVSAITVHSRSEQTVAPGPVPSLSVSLCSKTAKALSNNDTCIADTTSRNWTDCCGTTLKLRGIRDSKLTCLPRKAILFFILNPKTRFEQWIFFPLPKAFITSSKTTTKPNTLAHLFQDCHLFPPSCQNLQLFLLATFTGQLLVMKKLQHIRSLTFGTE